MPNLSVFVPFPVCFYEEMSRKSRLDLHLLTKGFAKSRQEAQKLIRAGKVRDLSGQLLDKPGHSIPSDLQIKVEKSSRFVSRGGEKLIGAIERFSLKVKNRVCLDAGISTGGFTDCLLQAGASRVYGIDVGYGQTAWSIRTDPRVKLLERTNIRYLSPEQLFDSDDPRPDFAVADLSFISLKIVLPSFKALLSKNKSELLLLVKPQFEVGRLKVGKGGIVRDPQAQIEAVNDVIQAAMEQGWFPQGLIPSPIKGAAGNQEYLLWLVSEKKLDFPGIENIVKNNFK